VGGEEQARRVGAQLTSGEHVEGHGGRRVRHVQLRPRACRGTEAEQHEPPRAPGAAIARHVGKVMQARRAWVLARERVPEPKPESKKMRAGYEKLWARCLSRLVWLGMVMLMHSADDQNRHNLASILCVR